MGKITVRAYAATDQHIYGTKSVEIEATDIVKVFSYTPHMAPCQTNLTFKDGNTMLLLQWAPDVVHALRCAGAPLHPILPPPAPITTWEACVEAQTAGDEASDNTGREGGK